MKHIKCLFITLVATLAVCGNAYAQNDPVVIDNLKFKKVTPNEIMRTSQGNFWNRIEVVLVAKENPDQKANNTRWIRNVDVAISLVYKDEKATDKNSLDNLIVMKAKARLFAIEVGKKTPVVFYVPGEAYSIYRIKQDPFAWNIELAVDGTQVKLTKKNLRTMISKNILKSGDPRKAFENYKKVVEAAASTNEGVLMPLPMCPYNVQFYEYGSATGTNPIPTYIKAD